MSGGGYYSEGKKTAASTAVSAEGISPDQNAVIKEAEHIRMNRISFEDEEIQDNGGADQHL